MNDPEALQVLEKVGNPLNVPPFLQSFWKTYGHGGNYSIAELMRIAGYKILEGMNTKVGELVVTVRKVEDRIEKKLKVN